MKLTTLRDTPPWDWPEDAGKYLLNALRSAALSEEDLLLATEMAGDFTVINDELAEALLALLRDDNQTEEVRGAAAISLGPALEAGEMEELDDEFDDEEAVPVSKELFDKVRQTLHEVWADTNVPTNARRMALEAAVRSPRDWQEDAIRTAYWSDDASWHLTAVFCMRYVRGLEKEILEALQNDDMVVRTEAMFAAGNWEVDAAWPDVVAVIKSKSKTEEGKDLLLAAIAAAGSIRPKEAIDVLGDLLDSDDEDVVEAVQEALAMAGVVSDLNEMDLDEEDEVEH